MELTKKQSRQLDQILEYLTKEGRRTLSVAVMNQQLFPEEKEEYCSSLFYKLNEHYPRLLYPESEPDESLFWASDYVKAFLSEGGFSKLFDVTNRNQEQEREEQSLNLEKLKYDVKNAKRIYKTYWWTFAFALIALSLSLFTFIKNLID